MNTFFLLAQKKSYGPNFNSFCRRWEVASISNERKLNRNFIVISKRTTKLFGQGWLALYSHWECDENLEFRGFKTKCSFKTVTLQTRFCCDLNFRATVL